jgi:hypothetical protein
VVFSFLLSQLNGKLFICYLVFQPTPLSLAQLLVVFPLLWYSSFNSFAFRLLFGFANPKLNCLIVYQRSPFKWSSLICKKLSSWFWFIWVFNQIHIPPFPTVYLFCANMGYPVCILKILLVPAHFLCFYLAMAFASRTRTRTLIIIFIYVKVFISSWHIFALMPKSKKFPVFRLLNLPRPRFVQYFVFLSSSVELQRPLFQIFFVLSSHQLFLLKRS